MEPLRPLWPPAATRGGLCGLFGAYLPAGLLGNGLIKKTNTFFLKGVSSRGPQVGETEGPELPQPTSQLHPRHLEGRGRFVDRGAAATLVIKCFIVWEISICMLVYQTLPGVNQLFFSKNTPLVLLLYLRRERSFVVGNNHRSTHLQRSRTINRAPTRAQPLSSPSVHN